MVYETHTHCQNSFAEASRSILLRFAGMTHSFNEPIRMFGTLRRVGRPMFSRLDAGRRFPDRRVVQSFLLNVPPHRHGERVAGGKSLFECLVKQLIEIFVQLVGISRAAGVRRDRAPVVNSMRVRSIRLRSVSIRHGATSHCRSSIRASSHSLGSFFASAAISRQVSSST
jgi:hypothetical protein